MTSVGFLFVLLHQRSRIGISWQGDYYHQDHLLNQREEITASIAPAPAEVAAAAAAAAKKEATAVESKTFSFFCK